MNIYDRHRAYENINNLELIRKLPVIIKLDGWKFIRVTKHVRKPFDKQIATLLNQTMLSMVKQVDGVVFAYQYSDKIILVLKNDQHHETDPWFGNKVQDLVSASVTIATHEFSAFYWQMDDAPQLEGSPLFRAKAFVLPSVTETINYLIYRQFRCMQDALNNALRTTSARGVDLEGKSFDEREELLRSAGIDFSEYPLIYRHGAAGYMIPAIKTLPNGQVASKHNWWLNFDLPLFAENQDFLKNIILTGSDIFRPERDLRD